MTQARRSRSWLRRAGTLLVVAGLLGLVEVGLTVLWQEPFSAIAAHAGREKARDDVAELLEAPVPAEDTRAAAAAPPEGLAVLGRRFARRVGRGRGVGTIEIPEIDVDEAWVEGTGGRGPGHYPATDMPGGPGTPMS